MGANHTVWCDYAHLFLIIFKLRQISLWYREDKDWQSHQNVWVTEIAEFVENPGALVLLYPVAPEKWC
jgi:hypothetical protein